MRINYGRIEGDERERPSGGALQAPRPGFSSGTLVVLNPKFAFLQFSN